ncbi:MAG: GNAT family N-acetyltransferase [candidate division Zixibacteria bacterium]
MPRALENLRLSSKREIAKIPKDISRIESHWGGIFYHPQFVDLAAEFLNLQGESRFLQSAGSSFCALNLLFQQRKVVKAATIPLMFQYFGPLFLEEDSEEQSMAEVDRYLSGKCDFAYFSFSPGFRPAAGFPSGWHAIQTATLALTAEDLKAWGDCFRHDVRNKIRKARKESVRIEQCESLPQELWSLAYTRRGLKPPLEPPALARWCERLMTNSMLKLYVAKINDNPVAFRGQLFLGPFAYDWIAGSDPEFHATGANQLLMAEIGHEHAGAEIKTWDLVGGQIKSIADFKKSFGARMVYHYQAYKSFNLKGKVFSVVRKFKNG